VARLVKVEPNRVLVIALLDVVELLQPDLLLVGFAPVLPFGIGTHKHTRNIWVVDKDRCVPGFPLLQLWGRFGGSLALSWHNGRYEGWHSGGHEGWYEGWHDGWYEADYGGRFWYGNGPETKLSRGRFGIGGVGNFRDVFRPCT